MLRTRWNALEMVSDKLACKKPSSYKASYVKVKGKHEAMAKRVRNRDNWQDERNHTFLEEKVPQGFLG